jgi:hypothetical protein
MERERPHSVDGTRAKSQPRRPPNFSNQNKLFQNSFFSVSKFLFAVHNYLVSKFYFSINFMSQQSQFWIMF